MIHCRPLMHPMFSPFNSTLGQSCQTINAHEFSPGERQKIPLSLQFLENQGNDLLLLKSNDAFFNLHSPWHFLARQTLHHSILAERLPLGFMGITQAPSSCLYSPSCLLPDRCPLTSRPFPVSACAPSPKAATDQPSSVLSLRQPIHEWVSVTTSVYLKIKLFLTTHFSSNFRTISLSFYHINFLKEKNGVVIFNQITYQNH